MRKIICEKPEIKEKIKELEKELFENTFLVYEKEFNNEEDLIYFIKDNLRDFWDTTWVEDMPILDDLNIRTNIWDYLVSFSNYDYDKTKDYEDTDYFHIESLDVNLTKI